MAGGQSEEPSDRPWQVNLDAGTLRGWGALTSPVDTEPEPSNSCDSRRDPHYADYDAPDSCVDDIPQDVADPSKLQARHAKLRVPSESS